MYVVLYKLTNSDDMQAVGPFKSQGKAATVADSVSRVFSMFSGDNADSSDLSLVVVPLQSVNDVYDVVRKDTALERCSYEGCTATVKSHYWGRVKSDWFFMKDGTRFCPDHIPEWVTAWRERKEKPAGS